MADQNDMENILASIHSILADGAEMPEQENEPPADDVPPENDDATDKEETSLPEEQNEPVDDVMKLTPDMIVGGNDAPAEPSVPAEDIGKLREVMASTPEEREDDDFKPEPVISAEPDTEDDELAERMRQMESDDVLMSGTSVDAAALSLKSLREFADDKKAEIGDGALTIEAIVRASVKPYLKEWLDVNLPAIVERIVKKEVAHIMDRLDLK